MRFLSFFIVVIKMKMYEKRLNYVISQDFLWFCHVIAVASIYSSNSLLSLSYLMVAFLINSLGLFLTFFRISYKTSFKFKDIRGMYFSLNSFTSIFNSRNIFFIWQDEVHFTICTLWEYKHNFFSRRDSEFINYVCFWSPSMGFPKFHWKWLHI